LRVGNGGLVLGFDPLLLAGGSLQDAVLCPLILGAWISA
jgi:hypothetical protein